MGGEGSGLKQKPTCKRCGEPHWPFVRCEQVPQENERDQARQDQTAADQAYKQAHRVIPQVKSKPAYTTTFVGRNYIEQAPGVFRLRRHRGDDA